MSPRMEIKTADGTVVLSMQDMHVVESEVINDIENELNDIIEDVAGKTVEFDFNDVSRLSTCIVPVLARFEKCVQARGGSVRVRRLNRNLQAQTKVLGTVSGDYTTVTDVFRHILPLAA